MAADSLLELADGRGGQNQAESRIGALGPAGAADQDFR